MLKTMTDFLATLTGADYRQPRRGPDERQLTAAALLVHLAAVDGKITPREEQWLRETVREHVGLEGAEADRFLAIALERDHAAGDFTRFAAELRHSLTEEQRRLTVTLMWRMALSDGRLHEFEDDLIVRAAELLSLDPQVAEQIRTAETRNDPPAG
jgi:uncharacterized tellurite resistance protein B-like protein